MVNLSFADYLLFIRFNSKSMKSSKIRWGILSTAKIGVMKVIPAIQQARNCEVVAIASRDDKKAKRVAETLGIQKHYDSYDALIKDPDIDVIYNPLPNNMHLEWSIKILEAGKHVLCEKPIGLNAAEGEKLLSIAKNHPKLKIMEAFMYRFHPQWIKVKTLIDEGMIGDARTIQSFFSYHNIDPENIRNKIEVGGGALMDIGCYCISFPRFIFGREPIKAVGLIDRDPIMRTDRLTSAMLDFSEGLTSTLTCATQLMPYQRVNILGDKGRIEVEVPVNTPPDSQSKITLFRGNEKQDFFFEAVDQYTLQAEAFADAIINKTEVPFSLNDAIANMKVIDAIFESSESGKWALI